MKQEETSNYCKMSQDLNVKLALFLKSPSLLQKELAGQRIWEKTPLAEKEELLGAAQRCLEICEKKQIGILTWEDANYPPLLREIYQKPLFLFYRGDIGLLQKKAVAVVGTRNPSLLALHYTRRLCSLLVPTYVIVSGMARGIDSMAHRTALACGGATIAVLAHGVDHIYPLSNADLYHEAARKGNVLLISEHPPETHPLPFHFVKRNRIISGLCSHVVFVEGSRKSGAVITANYALEQNRNLYCFDHPSMTANEGCKQFIADGATNLAHYFELERMSLADLGTNKDKEKILSEFFYLGAQEWGRLVPLQGKLFEEF
ncbi:MAG: DNA-processing protein DprA [Leptospiraceae bacterium]|nr:DNA-processing protein DprA [Leptospiraceae bacterium]MDW8306742.1 DNA-processing protein DprA [Leptospiraceae bacterium]